MKKRMLLVCVMLFAASVFASDFARDFQSAMELYNGGKLAEAEAAFVKLNEEKASPQGADESIAYAAYSAGQQKNIEKAMEYAGKIKDKSLNTFCRMKLLEMQKKWDEIIALSKDEDFEKWPEALIYNASFCRGTAYLETRNAENAEKDFLIAGKNTVDQLNKAYIYQALGNLYCNISKDNQKALDAFGEVIKLMTESKKPSLARGMLQRALTSRAKIFASQEKGAEALSDLEKLAKIEIKEPYLLCAIQLWYGQVYEIIGKNTEALESYRKATAIEKAPIDMIKEANQRIADLEKKMSK